MSNETSGTALKRVLNRSIGWTEMVGHSQETKDLDASYKVLLGEYDKIPKIDPSLTHFVGEHEALAKTIRGLETAGVTNNPQARKAHQLKLDAQTEAVKKLIEDLQKAKDAKQPYLDRLPAVTKALTTAHGKSEKPVQTKLDAWKKEMEDHAAGGNYTAATGTMDSLEKAVTSADKLAALSTKVRALYKQAATLKLDLTDADKEDVKVTKLLDGLGKAETGAKDLDEVTKGMELLQAESRKALLAKATDLESDDGGHSLDRHGPGLTDLQLTTRLTTGVAADGVISPTKSSTKFDQVEDWIETRENGIQKALGALGIPDLTTAVVGISDVVIIFDHGRAIDTGHVADLASAKKVDRIEGGNPVYELAPSGAKKWKRNSASEPLADDGTVVEFLPGAKNPKTDTGVTVAPDDRDTVTWPGKTPAWKVAQIAVYPTTTPVSGLTRTQTTLSWDAVKTKWKVVQHFPISADWDDVNKKYTTVIPPGGLISQS